MIETLSGLLYKDTYPKAEENFTMLSPLDFSNDFRTEVAKAKNRVWGKAMHDELDHTTGPFLYTFAQAAQSGLDTRLYLDDLTTSMTDMKFNALTKFVKNSEEKQWRQYREALKKQVHTELKNAGVDLKYLDSGIGPGMALPFLGTDHMKIVIVDDIAYIGGLNFSGINFTMEDFMVKVTDPAIVEPLAQQFIKRAQEDTVITSPSGTVLAIDAGKMGKSIISKTDIQYAEKAKERIQIISPFPPGGDFLDNLKERQSNGIEVEILLSSMPEKRTIFSWVKNRAIKKITKFGIPIRVYNGFTHSKVMIIDGKTIRFGSHNFAEEGKQAGTRELAAYSEDEKIVVPIITYYNRLRENSNRLAA